MSRQMNTITVNLDFDGVIADFIGQCSILANGAFTHKDITIFDSPFLPTELLNKALHQPESYTYLMPIVNAVQAVNGLYDSGYFVRIVTARNPNLREYVVHWLADWNIPYDDMLFVGHGGDKSPAGGDLLVDDKPENILEYAAKTGPALLFKQPWNQSPAEKTKLKAGNVDWPVLSCGGWDATVQAIRRTVYVEQPTPKLKLLRRTE